MNLKNIQRAICFAVGLLCMGLRPEVALAASVISGRELEPNNAFSSANGGVASGQLISGTTSYRDTGGGVDWDLFAIYVSGPGIINVSITCPPSTYGLRAVIYNSAFASVEEKQNCYNTLTVTAAVAKAGTYYIALVQTNLGSVTDYSFTVTYPNTPVTKLNVGPIFSSEQTSSRSFLRFYNTGENAGTVTATLYDYATGTLLGAWTSPSIPAGAELQYYISSLESSAGLISKPSYYSLSIASGITGYFQHVLYRPSDGTLTNLSTCDAGTTADAKMLGGVHSSTVGDFGFPSSIAINNTGTTATSVSLGIYDARNGTKLGTYTTASIPSHGLVIPTVASIEAAAQIYGQAARITQTSGLGHYVIKAESAFTGFLQHFVHNAQVGVITDMTTACTLSGP